MEKNLIKIYSLYFDIHYEYDDKEYPDFDKTQFPDIINNIKSNFKEFGFYKTILDINDIDNFPVFRTLKKKPLQPLILLS